MNHVITKLITPFKNCIRFIFMDICLCLFNKIQYALSVSVRNSQFYSVFIHCSWTCQIWYRWKLMKYRFILICVSIIKYFFFHCNSFKKKRMFILSRWNEHLCIKHFNELYIFCELYFQPGEWSRNMTIDECWSLSVLICLFRKWREKYRFIYLYKLWLWCWSWRVH